MREARRQEIWEHLHKGGKVKETFGDGSASIWPDCSPFLPDYNMPAYLAQHIETREYGFGIHVELI